MSRDQAHEALRESLAAAALDALPGDERDAVAAHAAGCAECGAELAALRDAGAALAYLAPASRVDAVRSDAIRSRLLARSTAGRRPRVAATGRAAWSRAAWVAMAASVALAASVGALYSVTRERAALRSAVAGSAAEVAAAQATLDDAAVSLGRAQHRMAALTGPAVRIVELGAAGGKQPSGRMFWERSTDRWTLFAHRLPDPAPGQTYQLWLVTRDAKVSAGTFRPNPDGSAVVSATHALRVALLAIAVTVEPAGGVPQPTGKVVLLGSAE